MPITKAIFGKSSPLLSDKGPSLVPQASLVVAADLVLPQSRGTRTAGSAAKRLSELAN
jgi:hypothetical protein